LDVEGCLAIGADNCKADEFQALSVGSGVEGWGGRSGGFYLHGFLDSLIRYVMPGGSVGIVTRIAQKPRDFLSNLI
jgi:hypothetical protein